MLTTKIHLYSFDVRTPEGNAAWAAFKAEREASGAQIFGPVSANEWTRLRDLDGAAITLDPQHLFNNQWNTLPIDGAAKSLRVFDWALESDFGNGAEYGAPKGFRRGHWLEQTPEMAELRRNTYVCGFCGHQEAAQRGAVFCPKCIGNELLKETDLHRTRMIPVRDNGPAADRAPLTEAERAHLLPLYREAQREGAATSAGRAAAKARADVLAKFDKATANATTERDGFLWLLDRGIRTDNVLFYSHTGRFGFGWRSKLSPEQVSVILGYISEFPFPYDLDCADGRKLSGN